MDVNLMIKSLFNIISDGEYGCVIDSLSLIENMPEFSITYNQFTQKIVISFDRLVSSGVGDFMKIWGKEYDRLTSESSDCD